MQIAARQHSRYEHAQSLLVKAKLGKEFGWKIDDGEVQEAKAVIAELQAPHEALLPDQTTEAPAASLSLTDRFDTILESGRKIATGLSEWVIYQETCAAACRLLRVHYGVILKATPESPPANWPTIAGRLGWELNAALVEQAVASRRAIATGRGEGSKREYLSNANGDSELCVPLFKRGKPVACLCVMHSEIRGLFGEDEERLADFLATISGAALENAEGFAELQELNATLERRVIERTVAVESRSRELATSNQELERIAHELRQAQVQLSASKQAAEAASEAKSRFLATMSHEIRTPMNGILGMAELVLGSQLSDRQRGYLETLKDSGNALLTLLNDLLDFSKIEAGKMELESISFAPRDVVIDSARLLAIPAGTKNLDLLVRIEPNVPTHVVGDPNRLRQVIVNLLGNAIKFTSVGEIAVHVSMPSQAAEESLLRFSIRDTGIGIPASKQKWIFEAFHQTDSTITRRFGGTGLGLAISLQLVQLMDGTIQVESEENVGTVFHVDVPFKSSMQQEEELPLQMLDRAALILSDHSESELAIRDTLEFLSVPVASTHLPADGKQFTPSRPVLIVDLNVHSPNLVDIVTRRIFEGKNKPEDVIFLIPGGPSDFFEEGENLEIEQILTKPVKPSQLAQAIQTVLDRKPAGETLAESVGETEQFSLRVLVADDSPVNREVAMGLLELCGHCVRTVQNGEEAVQLLEEEEFDLVFMDLEMPVMDGLAATRAIRQLPGEKACVPLYAMTAHALSETDDKCRDAGMDGYLTKPIVPEELMKLLDRVAAHANPTAVCS